MPRRTRILATGLALLLLAGALVGLRLLTLKHPTKFAAVFSSTVGLYPGSDVTVLGLPVGKVTSVEPQGTDVRVDMELDSSEKVAADTGAVIVAPTLVSDRYVQLTKPWTSGGTLAAGTVIPQKQTATPVEIDQLYKSLSDLTDALGPDGANKNGSLSRLVAVGADNLKGNGRKINTLLREFGKFTGTLSGSDEDLFQTVSNFKSFNDTLAANDRGVARVNQQLAAVSGYLADDRGDLQLAIKNLGQALAVLDDFIRDNRTNLTRSVTKLIGPTQTLVRQRASLEETVRVLPLALQNFVNTYNARTGTIDGRLDLNELTLWAGRQGAGATGTGNQTSATSSGTASGKASRKHGSKAGRASTSGPGSSATSSSGPPLLLPGLGEDQ